MKYRPQRGSLADSMAEVVEISDPRELRDAVVDKLQLSSVGFLDFDGQIEVKPYCYDDRTGWKTYLVTVDGHAVGFTDGPWEEPEPLDPPGWEGGFADNH